MSFPHTKIAYSLSSAARYMGPTPLVWVTELQPPSGIPLL